MGPEFAIDRIPAPVCFRSGCISLWVFQSNAPTTTTGTGTASRTHVLVKLVPVDRSSSSPGPRGVSALNHKVGDNAVELHVLETSVGASLGHLRGRKEGRKEGAVRDIHCSIRALRGFRSFGRSRESKVSTVAVLYRIVSHRIVSGWADLGRMVGVELERDSALSDCQNRSFQNQEQQ